ncbi:AMP-binding protein [Gordonia sp. ABSL1-1]|uniref:class I adenylate-forming enzyme family protein n=1 Tax=Gordonia sp. ABSL1-1 TaxID=3053923 RepID=UPI0025723A94|nr:AMP-binding protein [Gordonia sp. ABSL1-1]MDL9935327.1 AMP-binding protein [Gordonia sp. ABSL1-1]
MTDIDALVRERAVLRPDTQAFVDPYGSITWCEFDRAADEVAAMLADHGIGPGDRVGWLGPNTVGYPITLLGTWRRGASIVGLNFRLPPAELAAMTADIDLAHVVIDPRFADLGAHVAARTRNVADPTVDRASPGSPPAYETVWGAAGSEAMIYFTSGSTGHPKAVPLTRSAVDATMRQSDVHKFGPDSRVLIIPPSFHAAGASWNNFGLYHGYTSVFTDDASPTGIVAVLSREQITHTIMVPTLIHSLVEEVKRTPTALPALEHIGYGASPITRHLLDEAMALLGCEFGQVYGLSETGGGVSFLWPEDHVGDHRQRLSSAGRVGAGIDVEVRAPDGTVLPSGEAGELWFRSPCLTLGYLNDPEATARVLVDGWLNTRDVGFLDADGYIYVQGRSDDMIQTGGENVHPQAVEEVLIAMPGVAECAVFGAPDSHWGQRVVVAIVVSPTGDAAAVTESAVARWCTGRVAGYAVPKSVVILDELPRTASGKVKRTALVRAFTSVGR